MDSRRTSVRETGAVGCHDVAPVVWKLTLAYDGGPFRGWQVQPGRPTVQSALAQAIERVTGERLLPQGSGRTDAGVHALAQVASFPLSAPIPAASLVRALNRALPPSIRVLAAEPASPEFHARHSARSKLYEYRVWRAELCMPWIAPYVYACPWPLHVSAMRRAAALVLGEHDFTSFAARQPDLATRRAGEAARPQDRPAEGDGRSAATLGEPEGDPEGDPGSDPGSDPQASGQAVAGSCVRKLLSSAWDEPEPDLLRYQVRGTGFLHHMVRNLVGTFLAVGRGQIEPARLPAILAARNRGAAGPTAPARGLFLVSVEY